ncbi:uncharacterized protein N7473_001755 [Penicillium subrubescens]|uniref:Uncharacterized protein n=1 Tax=Penicillium subrubescens TaxID=1316194 RepID=A0A1Q5UFV4_9EURO|nr:uncharacterized protein N7473_001755 [Penicillium subrubescens]KAJ5904839.1 hypothetical protein N7473_001755 [Penicillium subrubescens]OKP11368.1 hypothetical protein PENSUB_3126 [Penicillium subrubescens]
MQKHFHGGVVIGVVDLGTCLEHASTHLAHRGPVDVSCVADSLPKLGVNVVLQAIFEHITSTIIRILVMTEDVIQLNVGLSFETQ